MAAVFSAMSAFARIDPREYVNWNSAPYNKIVSFSNYECTAQYVSKDIIITAAHCLRRYRDVYQIETSDGRKSTATLEKHSGDWKDCRQSDWAFLRIQDPVAFANDNIFKISVNERPSQMENAGFGWMRVLSDDDLFKLKELYIEKRTEDLRLNFDNMIDRFPSDIANIGVSPLQDIRGRLKSHKSCGHKSVYGISSNFLTTDCVVVSGNSGGPYFSKDELYAVVSCSPGINETIDNKFYSYGSSSREFLNEWLEMSRIQEQTIIQPPQSNQDTADDVPDIPIDKTPIAAPPVHDILQEQVQDDTDIQGIIAGISDQMEKDLEKDLEESAEKLKELLKIPPDKLTDNQFFTMLNTTVDYTVLREKLEAYKVAKARQNSMANRMLNAVTTAAMGYGMSQALQGRAEQRSDERWAAEIRRLTDSFRCGITGHGHTVGYQDSGIVPRESEAIRELRMEYLGNDVQEGLATKVKRFKERLGLQPGIESEAIIDTGRLYTNEARLGEAFNGGMSMVQDRAESGEGADRMRRGAMITGAGAVVGVGGNLLINQIKPDIGAGDASKVSDNITRGAEKIMGDK